MPQEQCHPALLSASGTGWLPRSINRNTDDVPATPVTPNGDTAADKMACALPENPDRMPRPFLFVLFDLKPLRFLKSSLSGYLM